MNKSIYQQKDMALQKNELNDIASVVQEKDNFLITGHINSDGDSISSTLLFAAIVKQLGKKCCICIDDTISKKFDFLPDIDEIFSFDDGCVFLPDVVVVLDASNLERIGRVQTIIPETAVVLSVDHHTSNDGFGTVNYVDAGASSTAEIVYRLIEMLDVSISKEMAMYVYNGIVCDTGGFSFPNTTHTSLSICADMVKKGVKPAYVAGNLYQRSSPQTLRALASALSTMEFYYDGKVSCMHLSNGFVSDSGSVDTEGFVDYLLSIEGTEAEFFMIEEKPGYYRVSFRSKEYVDVNRVAAALGGGGHPRAAGCRISGDVESIKIKILDILKRHV